MPADNLPDAANLAFLEELQGRYLDDPGSLPEHWRRYFESLPAEDRPAPGWRPAPSLGAWSIFNPPNGAATDTSRVAVSHPRGTVADVELQDRVDQLVRAYRVRGHMIARLDPLEMPRPEPVELEPSCYGIRIDELERTVSSTTIPGANVRTVRDVLEHMRETYCGSIGVQYMHIDELGVRWWLRDRMESTRNRIELGREEQLRILTKLTDAVIFEDFIQKKFTGAKSFSLEGAESLIPLLDLAIERAGEQGIDEIVMGMAHRGRLNVLANIMGKSPQQIFTEFEDADPHRHLGGGDVKYHLGHSTDWAAACGRSVHISLCFNPSHLEFVNTVALGRMRAKQDRAGDLGRRRGMVILIHGDAAFAGEGIVQETLNLSRLDGYTVGGTIHVVVNNQLGFTTTPAEGRSSNYATAVGKMLQIPIFHVNGENPEAVAQVIQLAMDFRAEFRRDVIIDMYCYRRRGHNESDEAAFTQPAMYRAIEKRTSVRDGYLEHLLKLGGVEREEADTISEERRERLERALGEVQQEGYSAAPPETTGIWKGYFGGGVDAADEAATRIARERLADLLDRMTRLPDDFEPHPKIERFLAIRRKMAEGEKPLDWAAGEALAFASLNVEGVRIRLTGQDSRRGTFSQRHAVLHDHRDGRPHLVFTGLSGDQAPIEIHNSPLSEAGVLGFEYGYSLDCPDGLVLWEAQFGDFVNAAQVIIDQFISSAEDKWRRLSGIVMLLPHGFEGMGPEHSSARLERFLMQCAEDNIQVAYPTTPAQYFHLLRRQALRRWRKPLVIMTPKSMLRSPRAVSTLDDLASGGFSKVISDANVTGGDVSRVILCSGKIYHELDEEREKREQADVPIIRVEELYPFPATDLAAALAGYPDGTRVLWVQEEPENMGPWRFMCMKLPPEIRDRFRFEGVFRPESASPATGSASSHRLEQAILLGQSFE